MTLLWIVLAVCLVLIAASYGVFRLACVRGREYPWEDEAVMEKKLGPSHAALVKDDVDWLRRQQPRDLYLTSYDGLRLHARWVPAEHPKGTVVLFHGWRSSIVGDFSPSMPAYHDLGFHLLLVDQRGQNGSEGKYITFGIRESRDVRPWVELHNREFGPWPVFLGGISMGATTVLLSAGESLPENVRGIVADCGFSSPWEIMAAVGREKVHLPPFPVLYLVKFWCRLLGGFDVKENSTTRAMQRNRLPVFLVHGEADHFVPCAMTQAAYDAAVCEKELLLVPGAGHGRSYLVDREQYMEKLEAFLMRNLPQQEKEVQAGELCDHQEL